MDISVAFVGKVFYASCCQVDDLYEFASGVGADRQFAIGRRKRNGVDLVDGQFKRLFQA